MAGLHCTKNKAFDGQPSDLSQPCKPDRVAYILSPFLCLTIGQRLPAIMWWSVAWMGTFYAQDRHWTAISALVEHVGGGWSLRGWSLH